MAQTKRAALPVRDGHPDGRKPRARRLSLIERISQRLQARRLDQLLDELARQHGPVPADTLERARRAWPED